MLEGMLAGIESGISILGPVGVFFAMLAETIFPPIPSELVMPLGGYVAYTTGQGIFGLILTIIAGTLGTTLGAVIIYMIAKIGGRGLVVRYGKMFFVDEKKIRVSEEWFKKHGSHAVFLCRMAPGLRELISIPAGLAKMNLLKFLIYTFAGSFVWSAFLGSIGYFLADAWRTLDFMSLFNVVAAILLVVLVSYFVFMHFIRNKKKR